jgi:hypothetical protein
MKFAHIIGKLYAEPLLIEESAWRAFFTREELRSWECGACSHCLSERQDARATAGELTWMIGE